MMRPRSVVSLLVAAVALYGCANQPQNPIKAAWLPQSTGQWERGKSNGINLRKPDGSIRNLPSSLIQNLDQVHKDIGRVSGVGAELAIVETESPNAFATSQNGKQIIAISLSWLDLLGEDRDALATTIGHEMGHLRLGHSGAARQDRENTAQGVSQILGTILNLAGVPMGGTIVNVGVTAFARSFSRDEERAADEIGLRWAMAAGYDPCGHARTFSVFQRLQTGTPNVPFLSTHPGYAERSEVANKLSIEKSGRPCSI